MSNINIDWSQHDHLLGTMPDLHLAEMLKCSHKPISNRRKKLNIQVYKRPLIDTPYTSGQSKYDWNKYKSLLGTMTDKDLGLIIGCKPETVKHARQTLNIKPFCNIRMDEKQKELYFNGFIKCNICKTTKNIKDFHSIRSKSGQKTFEIKHKRQCSECLSKIKKAEYIRKKTILIEKLGRECSNCNYKEFLSSLQLHHVFESDKSFNVSQTGYNSSVLLDEEANKCCILCSNCHDAFHAGELILNFIKSEFGYSVEKEVE